MLQPIQARDLTSALGLRPKEHVAMVGGGGKTSLVFALARELRLMGRRVVISTTTKVWHREAYQSPSVILAPSCTHWHDELTQVLGKHGLVFVGSRELESGKVEGISPKRADAMFQAPLLDYLIVEADGAAGRPVKAPAEHEPVIPSSATLVVALMGLEAMGERLAAEVVFRPDRFERVTGLVQGGRLTPEVLARLFGSPHGPFRGSPRPARQVAFLNKLDLIGDEHEARELAHMILKNPKSRLDRVVVGSILKGRYSIIHDIG